MRNTSTASTVGEIMFLLSNILDGQKQGPEQFTVMRELINALEDSLTNQE